MGMAMPLLDLDVYEQGWHLPLATHADCLQGTVSGV